MQYTRLFVIFLLVAISGTTWTLFSELRGKRQDYETAYAALRLILRLTLSVTLIQYGFMKLFPEQFRSLDLLSLTETYGESTPMHILWSLMSTSRPYMVFGGFMEAFPGMLLLFRRTTTAGLLIAVAVLANVVAMNFSFDVPVKLYSANLLFMAVFLLLPKLLPIWQVVFLRDKAQLKNNNQPRQSRNLLHVASRVLFALLLLGISLNVIWPTYKATQSTPSTPSPLEGVYASASFAEVPVNDKVKRIVVEGPWVIVVGEKTQYWYSATYKALDHRVDVNRATSRGSLKWSSAGGVLTLSGEWNGKSVNLVLVKTNPDQFELSKPSFHWVQEQAHNF